MVFRDLPTKHRSAGTLRHVPLVILSLLIPLAAGGCSKAPESKEALLVRANAHFAAERYAEAEKEYRAVLQWPPADPIAVRRLAVIYHEQGQLPQAYPLLKAAADFYPDDAEVRLDLAKTSLAVGQAEEAHDAALLEEKPGDPQALSVLANAATTPEAVEDTRSLVLVLRDRDQDRPGYHLALGTLALRQRDTAQAQSEFEAAAKLDPKSALAYLALAKLAWSQNDLEAADKAFKTAVEVSPLRSPTRLPYADFKLRNGATAEAKTILNEITAKYPDYLPPRVWSMKIACAERQDDDCAARVRNILAQDQINYDAVFQEGLLSLAAEEFTKAERNFEYLSKNYPQDAQARFQLALAYLASAKDAKPDDAREKIDNAESHLNEAVTLDPQFEPAVLLFAERKIRKGTFARAIVALTELLKQQPRSVKANYLLASAYLAQQLPEPALRVYRQMTQLFPNDPQPLTLIGTILLEQRRPADARRALEKSLEIAPDYMPAIERLVDLDVAEKQYAAALERLPNPIDSNPKAAELLALRAKIHVAQPDLARAETDLLQAIEIDPQFEAAYLLLVQVYIDMDRQEDAIGKLNAFSERRKDVPALMQLARMQEQRKNYPAARDAYEQLIAVSANFVPAVNNLAVIYSERLGQPDRAYELAAKARDLAPDDPHSADTLGWIMFKKRDYRAALPLLREGAGKLPALPQIQFHFGMAHYMLGQEEQARTALTKAVEAGVDFPEMEEARARLALLAIDPPTADAQDRADLEEFLEARPRDPAALARLAALRARDGNPDQAIKIYDNILVDDPLYAPAVRQLALIYAERAPDAVRTYDVASQAREAYPGDAEIAKMLGILSYRRGFYPRALELLSDASAKLKNDAELLY
jgi:tetratricopeptide (TPR) repeat protein